LGNQLECLVGGALERDGDTTIAAGAGNSPPDWKLLPLLEPSRAKSATSDLLRGERSRYNFTADREARPASSPASA